MVVVVVCKRNTGVLGDRRKGKKKEGGVKDDGGRGVQRYRRFSDAHLLDRAGGYESGSGGVGG